MGYSNFFFLKQIYYILKRSKRFRILLLTLIILFVFYKICFGATANPVYDVEREMIDRQTYIQNNVILSILPMYYRNSETWTTYFKPIFDDINSTDKNFNCSLEYINDNVRYTIRTYDFYPGTSTSTSYTSYYDGQTYSPINRFSVL